MKRRTVLLGLLTTPVIAQHKNLMFMPRHKLVVSEIDIMRSQLISVYEMISPSDIPFQDHPKMFINDNGKFIRI